MIFEDLRLQAVRQFVDFDLEQDKELLEIVELAAAVTRMPYAVISFLDRDTSYLKVRYGTSEVSVPRDISFCTYAIQQNELMVINDALLDERFSSNPLAKK